MRNSTVAVTVMQRALELDPSAHETHLFLGRQFFHIAQHPGSNGDGAWHKCIRSLEVAILGVSGRVLSTALNHLAWAHFQVGNHERSFALLERGLAHDEENCELHVRRLMQQLQVANFSSYPLPFETAVAFRADP